MKPDPPKSGAQQQAASKPSTNIHEPCDPGQKQEVVQTSPRPQQSQIDAERADWEGMGQSRYQPEEDKPKSGQPSKH